MAWHLSATTGQVVRPGQLLGTEKADVASREAQAEKDLKVLKRKMKKAGLS